MDTFDSIMAVRSAVEERRFRSAETMYDRVIADHPELATMLLYERGVMHQQMCGNGTAARRHYVAALGSLTGSVLGAADREMVSTAAFENMMLLSLSYAEYEEWATALAALRPTEAIVVAQRPQILAMRQKGQPWHMAMGSMSTGFYDPDPAHDSGGSGFASAIFELMLTNRPMLRMPRDEWRAITAAFAALSLRLAASHGLAAERAGFRTSPREIVVIIENAIPLVIDYVEANPEDAGIRSALEDLQRYAQMDFDALESAVRPAPPEGPDALIERLRRDTR